VSNDREGIGRAYVLRRAEDDDATLPEMLGFYTLSIALLEGRRCRQDSCEKNFRGIRYLWR
jgi:hypothetical protein